MTLFAQQADGSADGFPCDPMLLDELLFRGDRVARSQLS